MMDVTYVLVMKRANIINLERLPHCFEQIGRERATMKHIHVVRRTAILAVCLSLLFDVASGFEVQTLSLARSRFATGAKLARRRKDPRSRSSCICMDVEGGQHERHLLHKAGVIQSHQLKKDLSIFRSISVKKAERRHGMPWKKSIASSYTMPRHWDDTSALLYMPTWNSQLSVMKQNLTGLRPVPVDRKISYRESKDGTARIVNHCYASDEYRKIRMTYYDAGDRCQVFNSLWYPHPKYDLPVLGIDLLAFNRHKSTEQNICGKYLSVIDWQPIHHSSEDPSYVSALADIRSTFPSLQGEMSSRFYDKSRHFSSHMLYGRGDREDFLQSELMPAFLQSVQAHLNLVKNTSPDYSKRSITRVLNAQKDYDNYSSVNDPAHAVFSKVFGEEWATSYVYDFLFDLSDDELKPPFRLSRLDSN